MEILLIWVYMSVCWLFFHVTFTFCYILLSLKVITRNMRWMTLSSCLLGHFLLRIFLELLVKPIMFLLLLLSRWKIYITIISSKYTSTGHWLCVSYEKQRKIATMSHWGTIGVNNTKLHVEIYSKLYLLRFFDRKSITLSHVVYDNPINAHAQNIFKLILGCRTLAGGVCACPVECRSG